jgi:hemin uptake protein HemP
MMGKLIARMTGKAAVQVGAQMAAEQLLKNIPFGGLFAKAAIGVVSSQWIAAEKADLRSWISLPRQIQYIRVHELMPGEHSIGIEYNGGSQVHKVILEEGRIRVAYFSVTK